MRLRFSLRDDIVRLINSHIIIIIIIIRSNGQQTNLIRVRQCGSLILDTRLPCLEHVYVYNLIVNVVAHSACNLYSFTDSQSFIQKALRRAPMPHSNIHLIDLFVVFYTSEPHTNNKCYY